MGFRMPLNRNYMRSVIIVHFAFAAIVAVSGTHTMYVHGIRCSLYTFNLRSTVFHIPQCPMLSLFFPFMCVLYSVFHLVYEFESEVQHIIVHYITFSIK